MTAKSDRKALLAAHSDPVNFTCGKCRKVHKFAPGYPCIHDPVEAPAEEP